MSEAGNARRGAPGCTYPLSGNAGAGGGDPVLGGRNGDATCVDDDIALVGGTRAQGGGGEPTPAEGRVRNLGLGSDPKDSQDQPVNSGPMHRDQVRDGKEAYHAHGLRRAGREADQPQYVADRQPPKEQRLPSPLKQPGGALGRGAAGQPTRASPKVGSVIGEARRSVGHPGHYASPRG